MKHYLITLPYETDAESVEEAAEEFLGWTDQLTAADILAFIQEVAR